MQICVLNGSPKGKNSITWQTVLYLEKKFPDAVFDTVHVGQTIRALEQDMADAVAKLQAADLVLFVYPVYTFIAPYQLHRFVELLKERSVPLSGKYAAQISTSKHFYDVTAHKYVEENCHDMGMKYIGGLSADMEDLLTEKGRTDAEQFWRYVAFCMEKALFLPPPPSVAAPADYMASLPAVEKREGYDTVILTNRTPEDGALEHMIQDFCAVYPFRTRVINIAEYPFSGGCLGCFHCAVSGKCVYKDGFDTFLREQIQNAHAIVYAFTVKDHSMGASFKRYDDRQFCNGHRTVTMGMPVGYIVHGDLEREHNLQTVIEGRCDVGHNFLAGCATDARGLQAMSDKLVYALENKLVLPQTFWGVGGLKIFRDLIYLMRGMMKADHRFYKKHGFYDFPQKKKGTVLKMKLVGALISNPKVQAKMGNKMTEGMLAPYKKVIDRVEKQKKA